MKLKNIGFLSLALLGYAVNVSAMPDDDAFNPSPKAAAAIHQIVQGRLTTVEAFDAVGDLEGFVLSPKQAGMPIIMYASETGDYVVYGNVYSPEGVNLTKNDTETYVKPYVANLLAVNLNKAHAVAQGSSDAPAQMYVVADPNCSACHYFYNAVKPLIDEGKLQVHWILVTFLKPDSANKAAAILAASDPAVAMQQNEVDFDNAHESGGIASLDPIPDNLQQQLEDNMAFFEDSGLSKTPTLIYYADDKLQLIEGMPRDMAGFVDRVKPSLPSRQAAISDQDHDD